MELKVVSTLEEMLPQFDLVKQLNSNYTPQFYAGLLPLMIRNNYKQALCFTGAKLAGVCGFWINAKFYSGKYVELDNVIIDEAYRSRGIGDELCRFVLKIAKEEGCNMAMLDAYIENDDAHRFYERMGFYKRGFHMLCRL